MHIASLRVLLSCSLEQHNSGADKDARKCRTYIRAHTGPLSKLSAEYNSVLDIVLVNLPLNQLPAVVSK